MSSRVTFLLVNWLFVAWGFPSDPNAHLFEHMLPIFRKEEQSRVSSGHQLPVMHNETEHSLEEAKVKLNKLVSFGHLNKDKADKLMEALTAAQQIRHVAKVLESYNTKPAIRN